MFSLKLETAKRLCDDIGWQYLVIDVGCSPIPTFDIGGLKFTIPEDCLKEFFEYAEEVTGVEFPEWCHETSQLG